MGEDKEKGKERDRGRERMRDFERLKPLLNRESREIAVKRTPCYDASLVITEPKQCRHNAATHCVFLDAMPACRGTEACRFLTAGTRNPPPHQPFPHIRAHCGART